MRNLQSHTQRDLFTCLEEEEPKTCSVSFLGCWGQLLLTALYPPVPGGPLGDCAEPAPGGGGGASLGGGGGAEPGAPGGACCCCAAWAAA